MLKSLSGYLSLAAMVAIAAIPAQAESYKEDSLAVRILLVRNGLSNVQVSQVSTAASGRITKLDLHGRSIDTVTDEMSSLTKLQTLNLADNLLEALPAAIWNLPALVALDLSGNGLKSLDQGVTKLHNLLFLDLRKNEVASLPASFAGLENLETLLLDDNLLTSLPLGIADLIFLKELDLSGNQIASVPASLGSMAELDTLDLANNQLISLPDEIVQMRASSKVTLTGNQLCGLTGATAAWATGKDPLWRDSQVCGGQAVRPSASGRGPAFRAFAAAGGVRLEIRLPGQAEPMRVSLYDGTGRIQRRGMAPAPGDRSVGYSSVTLAAPAGRADGAPGLLWAEVVASGGRRLAAPVLVP